MLLRCRRRSISGWLVVLAIAGWRMTGDAWAQDDRETTHHRPAFVFSGRREQAVASRMVPQAVGRSARQTTREAAIEAALEQADTQQREMAISRQH